MLFRNMPRIGALACLEVKMIGKPYAGELHVRFDEGEQVFVARQILNGHEAGNGGDTPRIDLTNAEPVLYSTLMLHLCFTLTSATETCRRSMTSV